MADDNGEGRGIWLNDEPLPELPTAPRKITECTVTFTLTALPLNARAAVVRTMVEAANKMLNASNIYPCPQLRHVVEGIEVNLPDRVHGDVAQSVAAIAPTNEPEEVPRLTAEDRRLLSATIAEIERLGGQVTNTTGVMTLYVDVRTGRADGHGTMASPFNSIERARVHARQFGRRAVIRDLSGRLLLETQGVAPVAAPPPPPEPPTRPRITPIIRIH